MKKQRILSAQISYEVIFKKHNLSEIFVQRLNRQTSAEFNSAVKALCYDTIRYYLSLEDRWMQCIDKRPKDKLVRVILSQALAEFYHQRKPAHVIVNEAINTAKKLNKQWASGLINATLRKAIESTDYQASNEESLYSHPQWWVDKLKSDWKNNWEQLLEANNAKPPMWVRAKKTEKLDKPHPTINNAFIIKAQNIKQNELFLAGKISVQDASAQLAAQILNPQTNDKLLDMCAAPGGKTCHLLELNPDINLDAVELYPNRAEKIHQNLNRLKLNANVIVADANTLKNKHYDKILLDAPCSASGIVRRQVDIKYLRQPQDIDIICQDQEKLLNKAAELLIEGGVLLYATCSVFDQENSQQIKKFLKTHPKFCEIKLKYPFATNCNRGIQILTGTQNMDGFYYCLLRKQNA